MYPAPRAHSLSDLKSARDSMTGPAWSTGSTAIQVLLDMHKEEGMSRFVIHRAGESATTISYPFSRVLCRIAPFNKMVMLDKVRTDSEDYIIKVPSALWKLARQCDRNRIVDRITAALIEKDEYRYRSCRLGLTTTGELLKQVCLFAEKNDRYVQIALSFSLGRYKP